MLEAANEMQLDVTHPVKLQTNDGRSREGSAARGCIVKKGDRLMLAIDYLLEVEWVWLSASKTSNLPENHTGKSILEKKRLHLAGADRDIRFLAISNKS